MNHKFELPVVLSANRRQKLHPRPDAHLWLRTCPNLSCKHFLGRQEAKAKVTDSVATIPLPEVSQAVAADWLSRPACPTTRRFAEESPGFKGQGGG